MNLQADDIVDHVGSTFAERGEAYVEEGRIVSARIDGDRLTAECYGSREKPYRVEVWLEGDAIAESRCDCPVRGPCKHVAALLYAYIRDRESFADTGRLRERLEAMESSELVDTVMDVAKRFREVERFLEGRLLEREGADEAAEVDPEEIRRHAARAFESGFERAAGHGFDEVVAEIVDDLERIAAVGARHRDAGRYGAALAVWRPIVEVAAEHDLEAGRGLDELFEFLGELQEAVVESLEYVDDPDDRRVAYEALWRLFELDLDHGGLGLARPFWRAVEQCAEESERRELVGRVRDRMERARDEGWPDQREGRLLIRFLGEFGGDEFDLESRLEAYEELGAETDLVGALLRAGRREEALERTRSVEEPRTFVGCLERLADEGLEERAEELARERLDDEGHVHTVQAWLVDHLVERDRGAEALEVALAMLEQHPNREAFERVELLAGGLDRWEEVREEAVEILKRDAPRAFLQYVLDRDAVDDEAVEVWERKRAPRSHETWRASDVELELADRLAERRPEIAVRIWREEVAALREAGGPADARRAAELLGRIESVLDEIGDEARWQSIREECVEGAEAGSHWRRALEDAGLIS